MKLKYSDNKYYCDKHKLPLFKNLPVLIAHNVVAYRGIAERRVQSRLRRFSRRPF